MFCFSDKLLYMLKRDQLYYKIQFGQLKKNNFFLFTIGLFLNIDNILDTSDTIFWMVST